MNKTWQKTRDRGYIVYEYINIYSIMAIWQQTVSFLLDYITIASGWDFLDIQYELIGQLWMSGYWAIKV